MSCHSQYICPLGLWRSLSYQGLPLRKYRLSWKQKVQLECFLQHHDQFGGSGRRLELTAGALTLLPLTLAGFPVVATAVAVAAPRLANEGEYISTESPTLMVKQLRSKQL